MIIKVGSRSPVPMSTNGLLVSNAGCNFFAFISGDALTARDVRGIRKGPVKVGVLYEEPVIRLALNFPMYGCLDADFNSRVSPSYREPQAEERTRLAIVLQGTEDGVVRAQRVLGLSERVAQALHRSVAAQRRFSDSAFESQFTRVSSSLSVTYPRADQVFVLAKETQVFKSKSL